MPQRYAVRVRVQAPADGCARPCGGRRGDAARRGREPARDERRLPRVAADGVGAGRRAVRGGVTRRAAGCLRHASPATSPPRLPADAAPGFSAVARLVSGHPSSCRVSPPGWSPSATRVSIVSASSARLVVAVAQDSCEPQRDTAGVARRASAPRRRPPRPPAPAAPGRPTRRAVDGELGEALGLPAQHLVGHALEGLARP